MRIILIVLSATLKSTLATMCYTCMSNNDEGCNQIQEKIQCTADEQCVTMKYSKTKTIKGIVREDKRVHKFCQRKKFTCNKECLAAFLTGQSNCKAECCDQDLCNKVTTEKTVVKRDNIGRKNNASSSKGSLITFYTTIMAAFALIIRH